LLEHLKEDRITFEQLVDICKNYASAASCATRPILFRVMVMTILLDQQKRINPLEKMTKLTKLAENKEDKIFVETRRENLETMD
jgi:hypothetical protein